MGKLEKEIEYILSLKQDLRFEQLSRVLINMGYSMEQPRSGSSHYIFRKQGCNPITIPKHNPIKKAYIVLVAKVLREYLEDKNEQ